MPRSILVRSAIVAILAVAFVPVAFSQSQDSQSVAEAARKGYMIGARDLLLAKEDDPVLKQRGLDLGEHCWVARCVAKIDLRNLSPDGRGDLPDFHSVPLRV